MSRLGSLNFIEWKLFISQVYDGVFALTDYAFICSSYWDNEVGGGELFYPQL